MNPLGTAPPPPSTFTNGSDWYRDAVVYELHIRAFQDSDGDGIGDFDGLTRRLDYLQDLGINTIWLLPFYPSPLRDDGYDIADYRGINPDYGDLRSFRRMLREAHRRDLRVITELVINHTSDTHEWFQRSRRAAPGSRWRDLYVWADTDDRYADARVIFSDFESSNWTWDPVAGAYFWHRFYSHQPDLNYDNPEVHDLVLDALDFWLRMGVDGLRLDAIPYLYERDGTNCENLPETHEFLRRLRRHVDEHFPGRMLLAEANQWPEDAVAYFGGDDGLECHMSFHFPLMPRLFMAARMEDRFPIVDILEQTPALPEGSQWAIFLRNHDELTLEMVSEEERDYMYRSYADDPQMRVNAGIRRRLAPLLGNDRRKIELLNGLLLALPGTPVIYYGDEIGMGDNVYLGDRDSVRTPMQWAPERNAGFSTANPHKLYLPTIIDPEFHYEMVNVEVQQGQENSLFRWMRQVLHLRGRFSVFGRGSLHMLLPENHRIVAFVRSYEDQHVLVVANLAGSAQYAELDLSDYAGARPVELFGRTEFPAVGELPVPRDPRPLRLPLVRAHHRGDRCSGPGRRPPTGAGHPVDGGVVRGVGAPGPIDRAGPAGPPGPTPLVLRQGTVHHRRPRPRRGAADREGGAGPGPPRHRPGAFPRGRARHLRPAARRGRRRTGRGAPGRAQPRCGGRAPTPRRRRDPGPQRGALGATGLPSAARTDPQPAAPWRATRASWSGPPPLRCAA